jgi:hypothetical protein
LYCWHGYLHYFRAGKNGDCNWRHKKENDITVHKAAEVFCLLNGGMCAWISVHFFLILYKTSISVLFNLSCLFSYKCLLLINISTWCTLFELPAAFVHMITIHT